MRQLTLWLLALTACVVGPQPDPPLLQITSPPRSLVRDGAGALVVTGNVAPNPTGAPVASVKVNGIPATVSADGTFVATIQVVPGATLIHTVAADTAGGLATDTRSVLAGERRTSGSSVANALGVAISPAAFVELGEIATTAIKSANLMALIGPLNPVAHAGDEAGPDCLYAQAFVDSISITDADIALVPVTGGLRITAALQQPRITGRIRYAVACVSGASDFVITASSATFAGVLALSTNGMNGFLTELDDPVVQLPGLNITATSFPDALLNVLPLERVIQLVAPLAVRRFVNPMLNEALGALAAPQRLAVLGEQMTVQVAPQAIAFEPSGGSVMLDMRLLLEGTRGTPAFTYTPNGTPALEAGNGISVGIADDLVNDVLAQLTASGLLNLNLEKEGSASTTAKLTATSPPTISGDATDGQLRLVIPDMMVTFLDSSGTPVSRAAVNAELALAVTLASGGSSLAIDVGTPAIAIDMIDDLTGLTLPPESDFVRTITIGTTEQHRSIAEVLKNIPLPKLAGVMLRDASVTAAAGYVVAKASVK